MAGTSCCVVLLVAHLAGNAEGAHACGDRVEHLGRRFGKAGDRCLARHRVDGRLLLTNALECREPRANVLLAGIVERLALVFAGQKHRLDNDVAVKARERLDLVLHIVGANGLIEQLDKCRVDRIDPTGMPSMAQDRITRRKTEVEEFAGTICRLAAKHDIQVPQNEWLYQRIREIESSW